MKKQFILSLFISSFLISCGQYKKLSEEDYKWMPYKGNETLVFKSNTGKTDTIFILKRDTLIAYPEAQALNGIKYEVVAISCNPASLNEQGPGRRYDLFKVQKARDNRAEMGINLTTGDAVFYRLTRIKLDSLSKESPTTLQTSYGKYVDVYIIHPDGYAMDFYHRSNFVTKLYWSKSNGLIRYDKKEAVYWELEKKY